MSNTDVTPLDQGLSLRQRLIALDKEPFVQVLQELLENKPSPEALQNFAEKWPDKWAHSLSTLAKLAGFEVDQPSTNINLVVGGMSYAELVTEFNKLQGELPAGHADSELNTGTPRLTVGDQEVVE